MVTAYSRNLRTTGDLRCGDRLRARIRLLLRHDGRHRLSATLPRRAEIRGSSRVPVLASVECVVAVGIGVLALHETLDTVKILGIALVLGSVLLMNSGTQKTACS